MEANYNEVISMPSRFRMKFKAWGILNNNMVVYLNDLVPSMDTQGYMWSAAYGEEFDPEDHLDEDPLELIPHCKRDLQDSIAVLQAEIEEKVNKLQEEEDILRKLTNLQNTLIENRRKREGHESQNPA